MATQFRPAVARRAKAGEFVPGEYLTDGRRLWRVLSRFDPRASAKFAVLEDCMTLDTQAFTPQRLAEMGLQSVARTAETAPSGGAEVS